MSAVNQQSKTILLVEDNQQDEVLILRSAPTHYHEAAT